MSEPDAQPPRWLGPADSLKDFIEQEGTTVPNVSLLVQGTVVVGTIRPLRDYFRALAASATGRGGGPDAEIAAAQQTEDLAERYSHLICLQDAEFRTGSDPRAWRKHLLVLVDPRHVGAFAPFKPAEESAPVPEWDLP